MHIRVINPVGVVWSHIVAEHATAGMVLAILADLRKKLPENQYQFCWGNP